MSPEEIEGVDLPRALLGGFKTDRVAEHLRSVAWDVRQLLHDRDLAEAELAALRQELSQRERRDELEAAVRDSALRDAREMRATARHEAELTVKKAAEHAARVRLEVERERSAGVAEVQDLKTGSAKLRAELRTFIKTLLQLIEPGDVDANVRRHQMMSDLERVVQAQRSARGISGEQPAPLPVPEAELSPDAMPTHDGSDAEPVSANGSVERTSVPAEGSFDGVTVERELVAGQDRTRLSLESRILRSIAGPDKSDGSERVA